MGQQSLGWGRWGRGKDSADPWVCSAPLPHACITPQEGGTLSPEVAPLKDHKGPRRWANSTSDSA